MASALIRPARPADVPEILGMIRELARYERAEHEVQSSEQQLADALFGGTPQAPGTSAPTPTGQPAAFCHVVEHPSGTPASEGRLGGMALWFLNYSTWLGRHGVYLEDLYVRPHLRGLGYGQALLATLAQVCVDQGYGRLEWWVLDWNDPALGFYRRLGAVAMDEWTVHRVTGPALAELARQAPVTQ